MNKVMFISVHPDDETFGCGGAILKHREMGDRIFWLNLTGVYEGHPMGFSQQEADKRAGVIEQVRAMYGFDGFVNLLLPTIMLDTLELGRIVRAVDDVIMREKPEVIYLPNRSDVHSDHRIAFDAIYACTKNFRKPFIRKILMYETLSETEFAPALQENAFVPNSFMDITPFLDKKIEIARLYESELMPDPLPRSIHALKGLAAFRGSRIGVKFAEAFCVIFEQV